MRVTRAILSLLALAASAACNHDGVIELPLGEDEKYKRPATSRSSDAATVVFEYTPAPGQFINESLLGGFDGSETTPQAAAEYALRRMNGGDWVSLGGFGGFIVVGFDHSIDNENGRYNIAVDSNTFDSSSEPGIVWVMRDENGNGLPDDTWYELRGSEYGKPGTEHSYSVTYYRPVSDGEPVAWRDSRGNTGRIERMPTHTQASYYPLWIQDDEYTLTGVRLQERNTQNDSGEWYNPAYDWGYADNSSDTDRFVDGDTNPGANHFRISDAVTADGQPANLKYIDFVKIQTALNTSSGALGESSTEVIRVRDFNLFRKRH